jgi:hypothetical protein
LLYPAELPPLIIALQADAIILTQAKKLRYEPRRRAADLQEASCGDRRDPHLKSQIVTSSSQSPFGKLEAKVGGEAAGIPRHALIPTEA